MALTLYDATVARYLQTLAALEGVLAKGRSHFEASGEDLDSIVHTSLIDDMLPFRFQVISVYHHSAGAIEGAEAGVFTPPDGYGEPGYDELEGLLRQAREKLESRDVEAVNALEGGSLVFELGGQKLPFVTEDFLLSFSLPNFYFHATTAYDILRMKGVPIGKRDFLGQIKLKN